MHAGSGGLLERMTKCGPDILSIDGSVDLSHAITRCGKDFAYQASSCNVHMLPRSFAFHATSLHLRPSAFDLDQHIWYRNIRG